MMDGDKLRAMKVLLIDDDESIRVAMEYYFKKKTRTFFTVEDAEVAIRFLKKEAWDIIICDYKLPGMNGIDFFKRVDLNVIKILITAYASKEVASEARRAGIHDFIQKPFTTKVIKDSLGRLIEQRWQGMLNIKQ
jgi:DNA-binding NtrC family response regulator